MRIVSDRQKTLSFTSVRASARQRWEIISDVLDANPEIAVLVWDDLTTGKGEKRKKKTGARGMSADQVLRFAIVQRYEGLSFRRLHDRVDDSIVLREFCRVPFDRIPSVSALQENIKRLRPETLVEVNAAVIRYAEREGVEDGKRVRIDTTGVESNIHYPRDSRLLWDSVRVLTRILRHAETSLPWLTGKFSDHTRSAKKLLFKITNSRGSKRRKSLYRKLIATTRKVEGYGQRALEQLGPERCGALDQMCIAADCASALEHFLPLVRTVIEQAERRVIKGEQVAAVDKALSIFEPHADIIKKGQREIIYGHKVLVTGGKSNLILDCQVLEGNPADSNSSSRHSIATANYSAKRPGKSRPTPGSPANTTGRRRAPWASKTSPSARPKATSSPNSSQAPASTKRFANGGPASKASSPQPNAPTDLPVATGEASSHSNPTSNSPCSHSTYTPSPGTCSPDKKPVATPDSPHCATGMPENPIFSAQHLSSHLETHNFRSRPLKTDQQIVHNHRATLVSGQKLIKTKPRNNLSE